MLRYYRLVADDPRYYMDYTGCGNTLNMRHPRVLQLIMDSLRYWVTEMHVDGFRFDLASTLARELHEVDRLGAFFDIIHQDPVISQVKLIAEPWDLGEGGYQVGNFPVGWTEWNGKYRDAVRRFWRGDDGTASELATRLCGSSDLYERSGRRPYASINFVTAHDGFTLARPGELQRKAQRSQRRKQSRRRVEQPAAGTAASKGRPDDPAIIALRDQQMRNFLATLLLSQGVPMIRGGDEFGAHAAGQQQRLLPGQRDQLAQLAARRAAEGAAAIRLPADSLEARAADLPPSNVLSRPAAARVGGQGHLLARSIGPAK